MGAGILMAIEEIGFIGMIDGIEVITFGAGHFITVIIMITVFIMAFITTIVIGTKIRSEIGITHVILIPPHTIITPIKLLE